MPAVVSSNLYGYGSDAGRSGQSYDRPLSSPVRGEKSFLGAHYCCVSFQMLGDHVVLPLRLHLLLFGVGSLGVTAPPVLSRGVSFRPLGSLGVAAPVLSRGVS